MKKREPIQIITTEEPFPLSPPEMDPEHIVKLLKVDPFHTTPFHPHNCNSCYYIGSLKMEGHPKDFYFCDVASYRSYIVRHSGEGSDYTSYPGESLPTMPIGLIPHLDVLYHEYMCRDGADIRSSRFRLYFIQDKADPSNLIATVSPLTSLRFQETLAHLLPEVHERFAFSNISPENLDRIMAFTEKTLMEWNEDPQLALPPRR